MSRPNLSNLANKCGLANPWARLGVAVVLDAIQGARAGNQEDINWLLSDDAKTFVDALDLDESFLIRVVDSLVSPRQERSSMTLAMVGC